MRSKVDRRGFFRAMMGAALGTLGPKLGRARPESPTFVDGLGVTMGAGPLHHVSIGHEGTTLWSDVANATPIADILALRKKMRAYALDLSITMAPDIAASEYH